MRNNNNKEKFFNKIKLNSKKFGFKVAYSEYCCFIVSKFGEWRLEFDDNLNCQLYHKNYRRNFTSKLNHEFHKQDLLYGSNDINNIFEYIDQHDKLSISLDLPTRNYYRRRKSKNCIIQNSI